MSYAHLPPPHCHHPNHPHQIFRLLDDTTIDGTPRNGKNRLARKWMLKYGTEEVIWGVFAVPVLIDGTFLWAVWGEAIRRNR